ncbi:MAG: Response regulator PleD [bacterium ADurb.Bin400]|nr:MAG: Response regulator PleD [bacterium ADurb.Bin400]
MLEGKVILLVDDDLSILELFEQRLRQEGAIVELAHNGEEAINMAESNHPHVILLDLMMPDVDGFEVLKALKENPSTQNIPILVHTVLLESDSYLRAKELGASGFLVKTEAMPADVVEKIKQTLVAVAESEAQLSS